MKSRAGNVSVRLVDTWKALFRMYCLVEVSFQDDLACKFHASPGPGLHVVSFCHTHKGRRAYCDDSGLLGESAMQAVRKLLSKEVRPSKREGK